MVLIGIDPGSNTGAALYRDGELRALRTIAPVEIHALILKLVPDVVVFEDSRLQSRVWTGNKLRPGAASKVARDVGRIDAWCDLIEAACKPLRISCHGVSPKGKGAKLDAAQFRRATGWDGRSNQHERDAAMCAFRYRGAHG